jgi:hypothetical protein
MSQSARVVGDITTITITTTMPTTAHHRYHHTWLTLPYGCHMALPFLSLEHRRFRSARCEAARSV